MFGLLRRPDRSFLVCCSLALAALIGWTCFALSAWSSRHLENQVSALTRDLNGALAQHDQLQRSAGELRELEGKLAAGNVELNRTVRAWAAAQDKLATLNKRLDQGQDRVAQTGSINRAETSKRTAR